LFTNFRKNYKLFTIRDRRGPRLHQRRVRPLGRRPRRGGGLGAATWGRSAQTHRAAWGRSAEQEGSARAHRAAWGRSAAQGRKRRAHRAAWERMRIDRTHRNSVDRGAQISRLTPSNSHTRTTTGMVNLYVSVTDAASCCPQE
jgi:hypothetical protein